ncbi:MAG: hypothetical protein QM775_30495 [Pirellulales bacterium]
MLRVETGNVELAGLFAPKPLGMIAADDWTREIMTKGYPELQALYKLLGAPSQNVAAFPFTQYPHNYNYVSRAAMYEFFNEHLKFGAKSAIVETDFKPLSRDELTVWTGEHQQPASGPEFERKLLRHMTEDSDKQLAALEPNDAASLAEYRRVIGGAVDALVGRRLEDVGEVAQENVEKTDKGDYWFFRCLLTHQPRREVVPVTYYHPKNWNGQVVVWVSELGAKVLTADDGGPSAPVKAALAKGFAIAGPEVIGTGEHVVEGFPTDANRRVKNPRLFAGFTYGYNHPLAVQRAHDILTVVAHGAATRRDEGRASWRRRRSGALDCSGRGAMRRRRRAAFARHQRLSICTADGLPRRRLRAGPCEVRRPPGARGAAIAAAHMVGRRVPIAADRDGRLCRGGSRRKARSGLRRTTDASRAGMAAEVTFLMRRGP